MDTQSNALTDRYNREAGDYLRLWAPVLRRASRRLIQKLPSNALQRVLDVGTGVGFLFPELHETFPNASIVGIDRSPGMLALAPPPLLRAVGDAEQLPIASTSMDLVVAVFVLFHLKSPLIGLQEARRVLKVGGGVGTVTWAGNLDSKALRIWNECLDSHGALPSDPSLDAQHDPVNSPVKVERLMKEAGFGSVTAWSEDLVYSIGLEHLINLKTRMGRDKPRFDSLDDARKAACLSDARTRMNVLDEEGFLARGPIVYAIATAV